MFLLYIDFDLSLNTGYGINERESTLALLRHFPDQIRLLTLKPEGGDIFNNHPSVHYLMNHQRHSPVKYARFLRQSWKELKRTLNRESIDAVVTRPGALPLIPYLLTRRGTPLILKTAAAYEMSLPPEKAARWTSRVRISGCRKLFARIYRDMLGGDTVSPVYADWFDEQFERPDGDPLGIIPNGANETMFQPACREKAREKLGLNRFQYLVGYAGALSHLRNVELLIDSMKQLEDIPGLGLVIAGSGPAQERLEEQARQLGVADRVVFLGHRPYEEMPEMINSLDIGIDLTQVPMTIHGEERRGSFSQKIPQYLACGTPVIAWDTEDTAFIEQRNVGGVVSRAEMLSPTIRELLNPGLYNTVQANSRRVFEELFSTEAVARQRFDLWNSLVKASSQLSLSPGTSSTASAEETPRRIAKAS